MDRKSEDPRTLPPQRGRSQQRGGCSDLYVARIARQVRASHAPLAAKGHLIPTAKWLLAVAHGRLRSHSLAPRQHLPRSKPERLERVLLRAAIDSLTNLVYSDAAHAPTKSRTSHFRVHPWRPYHHIAAFPQSRWASAVMPMASDLGDSEIGSSSSGSQHAPLLPLASNTPQVSRDFECP
jgi:hypothetical protein